jgi:hypothetical protein
VLINKNPLILILTKLIILTIILFFNIIYRIIRLFLSTMAGKAAAIYRAQKRRTKIRTKSEILKEGR